MNEAVILDISSDDEVGFDDSFIVDNFDWISDFLEDVPNSDGVFSFAGNGGNDDVVVVGEVIPKPKRAKNSISRLCNQGFNDDDDCVVLNCDPDKQTEVHDKGSGDDSEDLVIIGEKGQVACRDYPHSRHLCVKFPFGSTPHKSHCDLCHCYVCDSLAPCSYWGSGVSSFDHCSATDTSECWKLERKRIRQLKNPPPVVKPAAEPLSRLPQLQKTYVRPALVARSTSTSEVNPYFRLQNLTRHSCPRPSRIIPWNKVQPHQVLGQFLRPCTGSTGSLRNSSSVPFVASSRSQFERPAFTGKSGMLSRAANIQPNDRGSYCQLLNTTSVGKQTEICSINLSEVPAQLDVNFSSSQPLINSLSTGTWPSYMQGYNAPVAQAPTSTFQGYGQSTVVTSDIALAYPSGSRLPNFIQSNSSNALNNVAPSGQQFSGVQNVSGSTFPCKSSDVPVVRPPSEAIQNFSDSDFPCNTSDLSNHIAESHQQHSADNPQVQGVVPQPGYVPSVEHDPQISGGIDFSWPEFDIEGFPFYNDPILNGQNGSDLFNMHNQPSVPGPIDAGFSTKLSRQF